MGPEATSDFLRNVRSHPVRMKAFWDTSWTWPEVAFSHVPGTEEAERLRHLKMARNSLQVFPKCGAPPTDSNICGFCYLWWTLEQITDTCWEPIVLFDCRYRNTYREQTFVAALIVAIFPSGKIILAGSAYTVLTNLDRGKQEARLWNRDPVFMPIWTRAFRAWARKTTQSISFSLSWFRKAVA